MPEFQLPGYKWSAHPARERAVAALAASIAVLGFGALIGIASGAVGWGVVSVAVLLASLNRFFLPSRFSIDDDGITARYPLRSQRFRWGEIRRFIVDNRGGYLSTRARRSRFDAFSGMHVLFGPDRRSVIEHIRAQLRHGEHAWAH